VFASDQAEVNLSHSPTMSFAGTNVAVILGTASYMSPEQAKGLAVDKRSDVFSFGSVLYEMLTGRKAFEGPTQASVMAAILEREPAAVSALAPRTPALVDAIVVKCLAKHPDARWQSAADLATALQWAANDVVAATRAAAQPGAAERAPRGRIARFLAVASLALATFAVGAAVTWRWLPNPGLQGETIRFEVQPPPDVLWSQSPVAASAQLALSPDGRHLAFVAAPRRGVSQIWIRPLDSPQVVRLAGTDGASFPFWSPDGRFIGFFAAGKLQKIDLAGGAPQRLADASNGRGGAWGPMDEIVFAASPNGPLSRVSAAGGIVSKETTLRAEDGAIFNYWPQFLPDGRRFLYFQRSSQGDHQGIYVKTLGASDATRVLHTDGLAVHAAGHLLFVRDATLFAIGFDDRRLQTSGVPVRVADQVGYSGGTFGYGAFSASRNGALAYGPSVVTTTSLQWRARSGSVDGTPAAPGWYRSPRLSPDQKNVALAVIDAQNQSLDILILDLTSGGLSRVTDNTWTDWFPVWAPNGSRLFFSSTRLGSAALFQKAPSAAGQENEVLPPASVGMYPTDVSSDGRFVATHQTSSGGGYDIVVVPLTGDPARQPYLNSRFNEVQPRFSPNGRWIAYASDETSRFEIYVRPFPAAVGQWPISAGGGMQPEWRRDGKELFYISSNGKLMAVDVATDGVDFAARMPRALFDVDIAEATTPYPSDYAVSTDGQRFLINAVVDQPSRPPLTVILNWPTALGRE
jgi:Tol biopolymer transport system component